MMSGGIWFIDPPQDISLDGYRIDNVIQYTDFVITLYFGIVVVALTFFVWKYHAGKNPQAVYDHGDTKKHRYLTIAMGLLVFLSVDVVIESMSFKDLKDSKTIAASYFLIYKNNAYNFAIATDPDQKKISPGTSLLLKQIELCFKNKIKYIDFIGLNSPNRGDYKLSFNAKPKIYFNLKY